MPEKEHKVLLCPACGKTPKLVDDVSGNHVIFAFKCCQDWVNFDISAQKAADFWNYNEFITGHAVGQIKELKAQVKLLALTISQLDAPTARFFQVRNTDGLELAKKILSEQK